MSETLIISILQLIFGFIIVGTCVLIWVARNAWMADNRELNNKHYRRSSTSWCNEHTFFDKITEFQDDFSA